MSSAKQIIQTLALEPHIEGGYFKRTYVSPLSIDSDAGVRQIMSSIYYMLTAQAPVGRWHKNRSDIVHFFHAGSPLHYYLISPEGELTQYVLSNDLTLGVPQLYVPGGFWKATVLESGEYGLLSEAVSPGFDFEDMQLGEVDLLMSLFPQHQALIQRFF